MDNAFQYDWPTTTSLSSGENPSAYGDDVAFTATVTGSGYGGSPSGTVEFLDGGTELGTASLSYNGQATFDTYLGTGLHDITAVYEGGFNYLGSTSSVLAGPWIRRSRTPATSSTPRATPFPSRCTRWAIPWSSAPPGCRPASPSTPPRA